jgi:hypothetical protein
VRHVGGEGDLADRLLLSVPFTRKVPSANSMSSRGLQQVGRDLLALVDDLVAGLGEGRAADRQRARAVGAHAEGDLAGVAVHDLDVLEGHAEGLGDELGEGGLVALAVAVAAGEDGDEPVG